MCTNIDPVTGIRYGVVSSHDVNDDFIDQIYLEGIDPGYVKCVAELKCRLTDVLEDYIDDVEGTVDNFIEELDIPYETEGCLCYENEGFVLEIDSDRDLWVLKSPWVTQRGLCSPCAPGACHLKSEGSERCYTLPAELLKIVVPGPWPI